MRNELVQMAIALGALVFGGAAEELLPKFRGVGFPVLLMASIFIASRRGPRQMFMFAAAAGAFEDALSSLPYAASMTFFCMAAVFVKTMEAERSAYVFAYPLYELWLRVWSADLAGGVFGRFLVSIPVGLATALAVSAALRSIDRRGAVDEG